MKFFTLLLFIFSSTAFAENNIARAVFTTQVKDREPVNQIGQLTNDQRYIYFFTEILNMKDRSVTHRWVHDDQIKAEITFNVKGNRWRVWSSKTLQTNWLGQWKVTVVDESGRTLAEESMAYVPVNGSTNTSPPPVSEKDNKQTSDKTITDKPVPSN